MWLCMNDISKRKNSKTLLHSPFFRTCEKEDIWIHVVTKKKLWFWQETWSIVQEITKEFRNNFNQKFLHNTSNKRTKRGSDFCYQSNSDSVCCTSCVWKSITAIFRLLKIKGFNGYEALENCKLLKEKAVVCFAILAIIQNLTLLCMIVRIIY